MTKPLFYAVSGTTDYTAFVCHSRMKFIPMCSQPITIATRTQTDDGWTRWLLYAVHKQASTSTLSPFFNLSLLISTQVPPHTPSRAVNIIQELQAVFARNLWTRIQMRNESIPVQVVGCVDGWT